MLQSCILRPTWRCTCIAIIMLRWYDDKDAAIRKKWKAKFVVTLSGVSVANSSVPLEDADPLPSHSTGHIPIGYVKPIWAYFMILCELFYSIEIAENKPAKKMRSFLLCQCSKAKHQSQHRGRAGQWGRSHSWEQRNGRSRPSPHQQQAIRLN